MRKLRFFLDVARHGNISRAAEKNEVTQSAVSQRLAQLESELGVRLLDRSVRPLALTEAGIVFEAEVSGIVDRYDAVCQQVGAIKHQPVGEVRVAAIYSAGIDLLHRLRERFLEQNPGVQIHLDFKRPEEVDSAVRRVSCDFGIVSYPQRWEGLSVKALRDERMAVVCSPRHPLYGRRSIQAYDLADESMVGFGTDLPAGRHLRRYLRKYGVEPNFVYEPDNIDTLKSMLGVGEQIAILPRRTVLREAAAGTLGIIELEPELNRPIGIIYPRRQSLSGPAHLFLDFLLEHADPDAHLIEKEEHAVSVAS